MADGEVRAQDLTAETTSTLSGNEQFVMFDSTEGKRADIDDVATYIAGDKTQLQTDNKTSPVAAINENHQAIGDLKEDLSDEFGTESETLTGEIIYTLSADKMKLVQAISSVSSITYFGKNIFDQSTVVTGKIKNDSGVEVDDGGSCYFSQLIPCHGKTITSNFLMQRIYYYDENKTFLRRASSANNRYSDIIPNDAYYIQVQVQNAGVSNAMVIWYGTNTPTYSEYKESSDFSDIEGDVNVVSDGATAFSITITRLKLLVKTASQIALNSIKNVFGTTSLSETDYIVSLGEEVFSKVVNISSDVALSYFSKNIFDQSTRIEGKTINDSGVEVTDTTSCYFSQLIPCHGKRISSNFVMQRIYYYDENKDFLRRESISSDRQNAIIPSDVYFIQMQVANLNVTNTMVVWFGDSSPTYSEYKESNSYTEFSDGVNIIYDGVNEFTVSVEIINASEGGTPVIPAVGTYDMWEPTSVTDDYKCTPLGQATQSIPTLNALGWSGFLETYYDIYLGEYDDGYKVYREDFGLDSGAEATGNIASPVYSYVFEPKYYNRTVLLSAGMNTCEASTYFGMAYFIKGLMEHTEDGLEALYNSTRFVVIPVICPSGIAHDPLLYPNSNGVRINKNFEYYDSWERLKNNYGGQYPDSEIETRILKKWLNKYRGANLYLDCHSDTGASALAKDLGWANCSDSDTANKLNADRQKVIDFYKSKGYFAPSDTVSLSFYPQDKTTSVYPKTNYAKDVTNMPAVMFEQAEYSTAYGSNGSTNNDTYAIKHYAAMIRYIVLIMCKGDAEIVTN